MALTVMIWLIIVRAFLSFFPHNPRQYIFRFVYDVTSPLLNPVQRFIPPLGGLDFSPVFAILALEALQRLLILLRGYF
ncbi:MAG: YggT family protein [Methanomassiliicoccales archaeon]